MAAIELLNSNTKTPYHRLILSNSWACCFLLGRNAHISVRLCVYRWWLQFYDEARNLSTREMCSHVAKSLDSLLTTRSKFIDHPLFHSDLSQLLRILEHWTLVCLTAEQRALAPSLSNELQQLWSITDLLFNSSSNFMKSEEYFRSAIIRTAYSIFSELRHMSIGK